MQISYRILAVGTATIAAGAAAPAMAQSMDVSVTLPRLSVAEYHRPYVAMWLEKEGGPAKTVAVWYDVGKRNNAGGKWLRDIRTWWRASGRSTPMPADGVSGATRAPGPQTISFTAGKGGMPTLSPGKYALVIEASRESGGREVIRLPFNWTGSGTATARAAGKFELGAASVTVKR